MGRRLRRPFAAGASRYEIVEFALYLRVLQQSNILYYPRFGIFFLFEKENACKKKQNCAHNKASKHRLKVSLFAPCREKKRLKCGRIPARLFLACHQKSNTFKCKQFCCAKPMCAYLSVGCPPVPRNATPQYLACESQLVARHIRTQTRRSLN